MGVSEQTSGPVRVEICGQTYSLRSHSGGEHIVRIARLVDERMRRISSRLTAHDAARVAVLTALNIADELESLRRDYEDVLLSGLEGRERPEEVEAAPERSWFEDIFDADETSQRGGERLSNMVSSKLRTLRQASQENLVPDES